MNLVSVSITAIFLVFLALGAMSIYALVQEAINGKMLIEIRPWLYGAFFSFLIAAGLLQFVVSYVAELWRASV